MSETQQVSQQTKPFSQLEGEELIQRIEELFNDAHTARRDPELRWLAAMAMTEGYHYLKVDYNSRKVMIERTSEPGEIKAKIDDTLMRYEEALGRFSTAPILPQVLPRGSDPKRWLKVRPSQMTIDFFRTDPRCGFMASYLDLIKYLTVGGTAALYVSWDQQLQMPSIETVPPWELFPIPASAREDRQLTGLIRASIVDREWVQSYYPNVLPLIGARTFHDSVNGYGAYSCRGLQMEGYLIKQVFLKPGGTWPKGRVIILVEDQIVFDSGANGLPGGVFPFALVRYTPLPNSWWGMPLIYRICNLNKEMNRIFSNMISSAELIANGGYTFIPSGICDVTQLRKQKGGLVNYTPMPMDPDVRIHNVQPPAAGSELQIMLQTVKEATDDVSAQHAISRGQAPGRVDSGSGLSFLRDEDMTPLAAVSEELKTAYQFVFNTVLTLCKVYWQKAKRISVIGDDDIPLERMVGPESLGTLDDLEISVSPVIPQSKTFLLQQMNQLLQMKEITPHQYKKGLVAIGIRVPGMEDLQSVDERKASIENHSLFGDGQQPGEIPEPVDWEDHAVHQDVHRRFASTYEFALTASDEVKKAFNEHMSWHMGHLTGQGSGMQPGLYDQGMEDFDQQENERKVGAMETEDLMGGPQNIFIPA